MYINQELFTEIPKSHLELSTSIVTKEMTCNNTISLSSLSMQSSQCECPDPDIGY
jgi:hypothetical protein